MCKEFMSSQIPGAVARTSIGGHGKPCKQRQWLQQGHFQDRYCLRMQVA